MSKSEKTRYVFKTISRYGTPSIECSFLNCLYYGFVYVFVVFKWFHDKLGVYADDCCRRAAYQEIDYWVEIKDGHTIGYVIIGIVILSLFAPGPIDFEECKIWNLAALIFHFAAICILYWQFNSISNNEASGDVFGWWTIPITCVVGVVSLLMQTRTKCCCSCCRNENDNDDTSKPGKMCEIPDLFAEDLFVNVIETFALLTLIGLLDTTVTCWNGSCDANFNGDHFHHYQMGLLVAKLANYRSHSVQAGDNAYIESRCFFKWVFRVCAFILAAFHASGVVLFFHGLVNYGPDRWLGNDIGYKDVLLWAVLVIQWPLIWRTNLISDLWTYVKHGCAKPDVTNKKTNNKMENFII